MKVSQELKDEFATIGSGFVSIYWALETIRNNEYDYPNLYSFLFRNQGVKTDNASQLQFAKWLAGEEEIEVEEELYYLKLPNLNRKNSFIGLTRTQSFYGIPEELVVTAIPGHPYQYTKLKFTKKEIETHPLLAPYASETFMVKVDDDV